MRAHPPFGNSECRWRRRVVAFAAVLIGTGVIATVRAGLATVRASQLPHGNVGESVVSLIVVPLFFFGVAAIVAFVTHRRARDFVGVFEGGVAVADDTGRMRLVPWAEVAHVHQEMADLVSGSTRRPHDTYRLQLRDGSIFSWNWEFERHREVGLCCLATLDRFRQANDQ